MYQLRPIADRLSHVDNRYYVLVAACVLARKQEWLRNAVLAAALLVPAVAALHGIVLAAMHIEGKLSRLPSVDALYQTLIIM